MAHFAPAELPQHDEFMLHYGRALAAWSSVEVALHVWFFAITGMEAKIATSIFYSARSFNGRVDMVNAAVGHGTAHPDDLALLKIMLKRASAYSAQRNVLAHGHPAYSDTTYELALGEGGGMLEPSVTIEMLKVAEQNFRGLGMCIFSLALNHPRVAQMPFPTPEMQREECRRLLLLLPKLAFSSESPQPRAERRPRRKPLPE